MEDPDSRWLPEFIPVVLIAVWLTFASVLSAQEGFVGAKVCGSCHPDEYERQSRSNHAHALYRASSSANVPTGSGAESADPGAARFKIRKDAKGYTVLVELSEQRKEIPVDWVFGAGDQGYTLFSRLDDGRFLEHRLSYYRRKNGFDITAGQGTYTSRSLEQAMGVVVPPADAFRCLACHSTFVKRTAEGPDFSSVVPGIGCERCHGPGAAHVKAMRSGDSERHIMNPGKLSGDEILSMCGECHRTELPSGMLFDDPIATRFQPIGLEMSQCFQESNGAITCLTCHNPHENARRNSDDFYNHRCLQCHGPSQTQRCKVRPTGGCISCHMPKTEPLPYMTFTDHWIRVRSRS